MAQHNDYDLNKHCLLRLILFHAISIYCKVRVWDLLEEKYDDPEQPIIHALKRARSS